jgi:hypothetical protein
VSSVGEKTGCRNLGRALALLQAAVLEPDLDLKAQKRFLRNKISTLNPKKKLPQKIRDTRFQLLTLKKPKNSPKNLRNKISTLNSKNQNTYGPLKNN